MTSFTGWEEGGGGRGWVGGWGVVVDASDMPESRIQADLIWERREHVAGCDKGGLCADASSD